MTNVGAIIVAVVLGAVIGSRDRLFGDDERSEALDASNSARELTMDMPSQRAFGQGDVTPEAMMPAQQRAASADMSEDVVVRVGGGLVVTAERQSGTFVGYRIVESANPKFAVNEVIVSINGMPVEDSAAGSELLIIALEDADAQIEFESRVE
jgi:hypothetical protein